MESLPSSIEAYLQEAGFSGTEIIVLKKLLEEDALTLRELAAKTGKSTGVLDLAVKKLLKKGILSREIINDTPKYVLKSLTSVLGWMEDDMKLKQEMIRRKHENFESYIRSLTADKKRPDIEYFETTEGVKKAYDKLLSYRTELLTYLNPETLSENESLCEFHKQYARRRQVHGVFQRVIAPDSPTARKFQSRDPFEYRKTVLISPKEFSIAFQKIIVGDTIACIDEQHGEASFIYFDKLAEAEKAAFEQMWLRYQQPEKVSAIRHDQQSEVHDASYREQIVLNLPQKVSIGFGIVIIIYWAILHFSGIKDGFYSNIFALLYGLLPLFSGVLGLAAVRTWGGLKTSIGKSIFFVSLGIFLWGLGQMIWSYYNFILKVPVPYPSLADFVFIPGIFSYPLGVIFLSDATGAKYSFKNIYAKMFAVTAQILVLLLSYNLLIGVARGGVLIPEHSSVLKTALDIFSPFADFLGLSVAVIISGLSFQYLKGRYVLEIWSMIIGLAVMFVADVIFAYATTLESFYNGHYGDLFFALGLFLLSFGVLGFAVDKKSIPSHISHV